MYHDDFFDISDDVRVGTRLDKALNCLRSCSGKLRRVSVSSCREEWVNKHKLFVS